METGVRILKCVLELDNVEVAMVTHGRRKGRGEMVDLKTTLDLLTNICVCVPGNCTFRLMINCCIFLVIHSNLKGAVYN